MIKDFHAQVKTIRPSAKWPMLFQLENSDLFPFKDVAVLDPDLESVFPIRNSIQSRRAISIRILMDPEPDPDPACGVEHILLITSYAELVKPLKLSST